MSQAVIRVGGVGKRYRIGQRERYPTLRDVLAVQTEYRFLNPYALRPERKWTREKPTYIVATAIR